MADKSLHKGAFDILSHLGQQWMAEALWSHVNGLPNDHMSRVSNVFRDVLLDVVELNADGTPVVEV